VTGSLDVLEGEVELGAAFCEVMEAKSVLEELSCATARAATPKRTIDRSMLAVNPRVK
jgi:hypothetical protein